MAVTLTKGSRVSLEKDGTAPAPHGRGREGYRAPPDRGLICLKFGFEDEPSRGNLP